MKKQSWNQLDTDALLKRLVVLVVLACLFPLTVSAQGRRRSGGPRVVKLEEIRIEGEVQKPNAFYILNRSSLGYEVLELRESFVDKIPDTVQKEPF